MLCRSQKKRKVIKLDGILDEYGEVSFEYIDELEQEKSRLKAEAEQGNIEACRLLGDLYLDSFASYPSDDEQAVYWYTKAAEGGDKVACIRLGDIYSHCVPTVTDKRFPLSIVQDLNKAYRYYKKAEYYKGMKRVQKQKKR